MRKENKKEGEMEGGCSNALIITSHYVLIATVRGYLSALYLLLQHTHINMYT